MEPKKISFGFSKISKKSNLPPTTQKAKAETKVELIKCLEGQEIKLVNEKPEEKPLIIPLKKTPTALASLLKRRAVLLGEDQPEENNAKTIETLISTNENEPEDIEKRAARELLAEIQKTSSSEETNKLVLPIVKPDDLPLDGSAESTLSDYENMPIKDFGKAMLRGMGWTEPLSKVNQKGDPPKDDTPMTRPKGMGLGADKVLSKKTYLIAPEANEVLELKRNAFVRILDGKHKDLYGQIEGFDEYGGRVILKMAIGGAKESFNEFLCHPVSKKEYSQYAKCINSSKYDEYKKKENEYGQIVTDKSDKDLKKQQDSVYDKNRQHKDDYKRSDRYEEKYVKQEKNIIKKEENGAREDYKYDTKFRNDALEGMKGTSRNANRETNHRTYGDRSPRRYQTHKDEYRYRQHDDKKTDVIKEERRHIERSTSRDRVRQRKARYQLKGDTSDSESEAYSNKHKKSKSSHSKKKSKKSKSKSKYKNTSTDTETSSSSSESSSNSEEERRKRHKKKTKKSKKQRERSRSRGRR